MDELVLDVESAWSRQVRTRGTKGPDWPRRHEGAGGGRNVFGLLGEEPRDTGRRGLEELSCPSVIERWDMQVFLCVGGMDIRIAWLVSFGFTVRVLLAVVHPLR